MPANGHGERGFETPVNRYRKHLKVERYVRKHEIRELPGHDLHAKSSIAGVRLVGRKMMTGKTEWYGVSDGPNAVVDEIIDRTIKCSTRARPFRKNESQCIQYNKNMVF